MHRFKIVVSYRILIQILDCLIFYSCSITVCVSYMENSHLLELMNALIQKNNYLSSVIVEQNSQISEILERQVLCDKVLHRIDNQLRNLAKAEYSDINMVRNNSNFSSKDEMPIRNNQYQINYDSQNPYGAFHSSQTKPHRNSLPDCHTPDNPKSFNSGQSRVISAYSNTSNSSNGRKKVHSIPKNLLNSKILLRPHTHNININKFAYEENRISMKINGWHQLMMDKVIDLKQKGFFNLRVVNSVKNNIIVGIASAERMQCQNSHGSGKQIGIDLGSMDIYMRGAIIRSDNKMVLKPGFSVKVQIEKNEIRWLIDDNLIGQVTIPVQLRLCPLCPYFEMHDKTDTIELI